MASSLALQALEPPAPNHQEEQMAQPKKVPTKPASRGTAKPGRKQAATTAPTASSGRSKPKQQAKLGNPEQHHPDEIRRAHQHKPE